MDLQEFVPPSLEGENFEEPDYQHDLLNYEYDNVFLRVPAENYNGYADYEQIDEDGVEGDEEGE